MGCSSQKKGFHVLTCPIAPEKELSISPLKAHSVFFTHPFHLALHCAITPGEHWEKGGLYTRIKCEVPEDRDNWSQGSRHPCFISLLCLQGSTGPWQLDQVVVGSLALERESSAWVNCPTIH